MKNEVSSEDLGKLAAQALKDPKATKREKSLAASVLTQRPDNNPAPETTSGPRFLAAVSAGDTLSPGQINRDDLTALRISWADDINNQRDVDTYLRVVAWLDTLLGGSDAN